MVKARSYLVKKKVYNENDQNISNIIKTLSNTFFLLFGWPGSQGASTRPGSQASASAQQRHPQRSRLDCLSDIGSSVRMNGKSKVIKEMKDKNDALNKYLDNLLPNRH